jgi:Protein of unknown function (DUF3126)
LDKGELHKLQEFLRSSFGNQNLRVTPGVRETESADLALGERKIGSITVDDEDGDRSFALEVKIPVERPTLESYLRKLFENDKLRVVARLNKTDSVELNSGSDFIGVVSADDPKAKSFTLQMAILDFDLDEI